MDNYVQVSDDIYINLAESDEIAEDIFRAVRGFMRHLATKLSE